jgi:putative multiple sugar transport system permease protein
MSIVKNSQSADVVKTGSVAGTQVKMSFVKSLQKVVQENIRDYGMYIALFVIIEIFTVSTNGLFISSRNIVNLINQAGYIVVLAVGMMLVIVIRHIDLSVGFLSGFIGAIAAIALKYWGLPVWVVIPMALAIGALAGSITAFLVAQLNIPAFVATLAGWLIYRGAILVVLASTGTIIISDEVYNAIGNGFIPDIFPADSPILPGLHKLTLILGLLGIIFFIISQINDRRKKQAYHFEVLPMNLFVLKLVFVAALVGSITWILAGYQGLSWTTAVVLIVVGVYHFITTQTVLGRHIYAVGGNPEAAQLSGINVKRLTYIVFGSMGMLAALAGIMFSSRLRSATPQAGNLFELDAIAAAFIGGVSPAGGVGKVVSALIGALVYLSLSSGMNLMGTGIEAQYIVRGAVLAAAVIFDVATRTSGGKSFSRILFSFKGRVNQADFWLGLVLNGLIAFILLATLNFVLFALGAIVPALGKVFQQQPLINTVLTVLLVYAPALWMWLALSVKRWHDVGRSGWFVIINIVLFVIAFALYESGVGGKAGWWGLIFLIPIVGLGFVRGSSSANRFDEQGSISS